MKFISKTMQAAWAAKNEIFHDEYKNAFVPMLSQLMPEASKYRDIFDKYSNKMFSYSVRLRGKHFSSVLDENADKYKQLIILCGGLDFNFAYKQAWKNKPIFFIDHPDSLEFTLSLLEQPLHSKISFVECDLNNITLENLKDKLTFNGFDVNLPTLIIWEGSSYYFTPETILNVIAVLSGITKLCKIYADFANRESFEKNANHNADSVDHILNELNDIKEPWYGFMNPNELTNYFTQHEFEMTNIYWDSEIEQRHEDLCYLNNKTMFYLEAIRSDGNE